MSNDTLTQTEHDDGLVTFTDSDGKIQGCAKVDLDSGECVVLAQGQNVEGVILLEDAAEAIRATVAAKKRRQQRAATQAATGSRGTLAPLALNLSAPGNPKYQRLVGRGGKK